MQELVRVENLKKYFKTPLGMLHAVDDVSFSIKQNTTLGVVGESGCGKSTLGRTALHLLKSTDGKIFFEGKDVTNVNKRQLRQLRRNMQIIFQDPFSSLNPRMCVKDIIIEPLKIYKVCKSKGELEDKAVELMSTVGLSTRLALSYPHELDGGRRQRIGVARALALNPKFIICDEPVSALDVSIQAQILNLMQDLQKERDLTYLFITHNLSVVKHISDEILVMYLGKVIEYAKTEDLFARPLHPYTQALLSAIPVPDYDYVQKRVLLKGEISSPIEPQKCCRFAGRCPAAQEICFKQEPKMVDMGIRHLTACHFAGQVNLL